MITIDDIKGLRIAGYRYGKAPENGYSYNTREREYECGVSMAQVGYDKEVRSFAVDAQEQKKYYYVGNIAGTGGDDEICLTNVKPITAAQYRTLRRELSASSDAVVNYNADRELRFLDRGYDIGRTRDEVEQYRNKYLRKKPGSRGLGLVYT